MVKPLFSFNSVANPRPLFTAPDARGSGGGLGGFGCCNIIGCRNPLSGVVGVDARRLTTRVCCLLLLFLLGVCEGKPSAY